VRPIFAVLALLSLFSAGCDKAQLPDTVPPAISWVSPHNGDSVAPGVYSLVTVATDDRQMDFVAFFVGDEMLGLVSTAKADTYRIAVDCSADTAHVYVLRAFAYDKASNGTSANVTVYIRR
jgi:hypothetical protein